MTFEIGAKFSMDHLRMTQVQLQGLKLGTGQSLFVEPFGVFKGKLCAAATRDKFHDSVDLRTLLSRHGDEIRPRIGELNLKYVGLAIKRYAMLERMFLDLGVNVEKAKQLAGKLNETEAYPRGPGQVQYALLG